MASAPGTPRAAARERWIDEVRAALAARARNRIATYFYACHAVSPADSVDYRPAGTGEQRQFARLIARGIVRRVDERRYWLDIAAYDADERALRARMVPIVVALSVTVAVVAMFFYRTF